MSGVGFDYETLKSSSHNVDANEGMRKVGISDRKIVSSILATRMSLSKDVPDTNVLENASLSSSLPSSFSGTKNTSLASLPSSKTRVSTKIYGADKMMTLASLLRYLEGYEIIVEMKTGKRHQGILQNADDDMNMTLLIKESSVGDDAVARYPAPSSDMHQQQFQIPSATLPLVVTEGQRPTSSSTCAVIWTSAEHVQGERQPSSSPSQMTIRGSQIRYVQFPDNANLSSIVLSGREREQQARNKYRKTVRKSSKTQL
jgi:small nuclear ribonucleoprotein (snRNP)-like protein